MEDVIRKMISKVERKQKMNKKKFFLLLKDENDEVFFSFHPAFRKI